MHMNVGFPSNKGSANRLLLGFTKMYIHIHNKEMNNLAFLVNEKYVLKSHGTLNSTAKIYLIRLLEFYLLKITSSNMLNVNIFE